MLGWTFFPWQADAANIAGEYDGDTKRPFYRTVGISVARQNGKTTLVCSRIARQLIPSRQTVAYTAQDRGLARTKWAEHVELLMSTPFAEKVARVEYRNHNEMLVMHNGSRYLPVTPSRKKAGRSLSIDLAIVDEAHSHPDLDVVSAIQPAMSARPYAQLWLLSNAGDWRSGLWRHYTEVGRHEAENPSSPMCWIEYSADPEADVMDEQAWLDANPSLDLPGGVLRAALADGALTIGVRDPATFKREALNVWADGSTIVGIDAVTWAACTNDTVRPGTDVALGLDFTPERDHGALVLAGCSDELVALEVLEHSANLAEVVQKAADVANRWDALVTIDRGSPAASAVPALERLTARGDGTHRVRLVGVTELARAAGDFHDAAVHATISHRGDYRLTDAVLGATRRKLGDAWVWDRRGKSDITPLVAATLARWGIVAAPEPLQPAVY
jgi:phage terminase large subunit-like protein